MATYKSFKELNGKTLKFGDKVIFTVKKEEITYTVQSKYLDCLGDIGCLSDNFKIFDLLRLKKKEFCSNYYGYLDKRGGFPECKFGDYEALTRVTLALFCVIEDGTDEGLTFLQKDGSYKPMLFNSMRLTDTYNIELWEDKWIVGCQEIPISKVKEVIELHKKLYKTF